MPCAMHAVGSRSSLSFKNWGQINQLRNVFTIFIIKAIKISELRYSFFFTLSLSLPLSQQYKISRMSTRRVRESHCILHV